MSILDVLPKPTQLAWHQAAPVVPPAAYLMGGTALAIRLQHRQSQDLDFFLDGPADLHALAERLRQLALLDIQMLTEGTLNVLFGGTKLQFLDARAHHQIEEPDIIESVRVGSLADLFASKLVVITGRPAIRDYVDLWAIETIAGLRVEEGLALVEQRYPQARQQQTWRTILLALGSFDDVRGDVMPRMHGCRVSLQQIERYWSGRVPQIAQSLSDR